MGRIMPDPEERNDERAGFARGALETYARLTHGDSGDGDVLDDDDNKEFMYEVITDLLADLRHFCDSIFDVDEWGTLLAGADFHYQEEIASD